MKTHKIASIMTLMFAGIVFNVSACLASKPLDESQQVFFSQFRYAVQAHDVGLLMRLTHPNSKKCVSLDEREFYYGKILDSLVKVLGKRQIVKRLSVKNFTPGEIDISRELPSGGKVNWPVTPEVMIVIQYEQDTHEAVGSLYLAKDNDKWKWIHICAPEKGI